LIIAIAHNSKFIVSGGSDKTLRPWNLDQESQEAVLEGYTSWVYAVAIISDNKYAVSGSADKNLIVWNLQNKQQEFLSKAILTL
jgi:WD40 repeat protein